MKKTGFPSLINSAIGFFIFAFSFLLIFVPARAGSPAREIPQSILSVSGHIHSESGIPVEGASVRVKGTNTGTASDASGFYSVNAPDNGTLIVSSIGYETIEIPVNGRTSIDIILKSSAITGEQVVVIGYGTQRKRDVTGSIASVKGSELSKQPVLTATQALQGKVAGVQIISSGAPNSAPTVRIRGTGSILGGEDPLYVVDGVITNDIRNINTADILTEEILKDASSAAIYGVRAANGVIIITTKKGRGGKMQISYDANAGIRQASKIVKMANSAEYTTYLNEAAGTTIVDPALAATTSTDWYGEILRTAFEQNHNISLSGGSDKINYFFSAGYLTDQGIVLNNTFRRFTLRSNNEYIISKKLRANTLVSFSNGNTQDVNLGTAYNDAYHAAPVIPGKVNGRYGNTSGYQNVGNPILDIENNDNRYQENRLQATAYIEYKPVEWLTLRSSYGTDLGFNNRRVYNYQFGADSITFIPMTGLGSGNQYNNKSNLSVTDERNNRWVWDNTATFKKTFNKSDLTVLAGTTAERIFTSSNSESRSDVPAEKDLWYIGAGDPATQTNSSGAGLNTRISYLGRVNYAYDKKYLLTATFRADGSSLFSKNYSYDPSIGIGWIITDEKFMEHQKIFNNLKIRASYGRLGNDAIPTTARFLTLSTGLPYVFNGTVVNTGAYLNGFVDKNIKWENTDEADAGLEFAVLHSRLSGELDFYDKKVNNALISVPVLGNTGTTSVITNLASIENKGVELSLNWNDKVGKNITYNASVNGSYNNNKVVNLRGGQYREGNGIGSNGDKVNRTDNGQPIGSFYVLQSEGVIHNQTELAAYVTSTGNPITINGQIPQLGDLKYADLNGDGIIDNKDRAYAGSYNPKFTFGFTLGFNYKQFDLSMIGYGTLGSKIYNAKKAARFNSKDNIEASVADNRWTFTNYASNVPRAILTALPQSTYFIESGDFARINNLTVGYTFKPAMLSKYHVSSLRLYATAQNLATFTNYSGFSPEVPQINTLTPGVELNAYPTTRSYAFGINLNF